MYSTQTKLSVREAGDNDVALLLDFYQLLEFGPAAQRAPKVGTMTLRRYRAYPNYRVYIALLDKIPVGTFALLIVDTLAHAGRPFGIVEDVVVGRNARRRGVGRQMMAFAMQRCKEAGCYKMALSSHLERPEAHAFYESLGFARHGVSFLVT